MDGDDADHAGHVRVQVVRQRPRKAKSVAVTVDRALTPPPVASSLSPDTVVAGGSAFTLTVRGSQFVPWSVVRWNGANRTTTFVSSTELQAAIDAADVATGGPAQVSVLTPAPGGGTSGTLTFTIVNPAPTLTVNATSVTGGTAVTVTLTNGLGGATDWIAFADASSPNTSSIIWTYVGAGVTTRTWTVTTPITGGPFEFRLFPNDDYIRAATSPRITILAPVPVITSLDPSGALAGSASLSLNVYGSNFTPASVVRWNGSPRTTTYVGPTQLSATITSADLAAVGTPAVTVFTPAPGGGTSNAVTFNVTGRRR